MLELILKILLVLATLILSTYTIILRLENKDASKALLLINLILLIFLIFFNPIILVSDYLDKEELLKTNQSIKSDLDSTKAEFDKQIFTLKQLYVDLEIVVYPKNIPTFDDFTLLGERGIFLADSNGTLFPLVQDIYFMVPEMKKNGLYLLVNLKQLD